jgi:transglutaminase-like putative cysteine protease
LQLLIDHVTRYRYSEPAHGVVQLLRLTPRDSDGQRIRHWRIDLDADGRLFPFTDAYGNACHIFYAERPLDTLTLHVAGAVTTSDGAGVVTGTEEPLPPAAYRRTTSLTAPSPAIRALAESARGDDAIGELHALMLAVHVAMAFAPGLTEPATDAATALALGQGVCQDLAQVFIAAARHLGHPARYVSGHYAAPDHPEQEAAHAWAECHVPGLGWVSFDPTHGDSGTEGHVRVAVGLDSLEAAPVRGSRRGGGQESLAVGVHGREDARAPARAGQWQVQSIEG